MDKSRAQQRRDKKKQKKSPAAASSSDELPIQKNSSVKKLPRSEDTSEKSSQKLKKAKTNQHGSEQPSVSFAPSPLHSSKPNPKNNSSSSSARSSSSLMDVFEPSKEELMDAINPHQNYQDILSDESLDSTFRARALLAWIVAPLSPEEFMEQYYEKQPVLIRRSTHRSWYDGLMSKRGIEKKLSIQRLIQGHEVTLSRYDPIKKVRVNLHQDGLPLLVSKFNSALNDDGASARLLAPQKYFDTLWAVMSGLEEQFGAMVGANAYLTPSGEQGFAPHFDDIEAFIMQLEGKKRWRVYSYPVRSDMNEEEDDEEGATASRKSEKGEEEEDLTGYDDPEKAKKLKESEYTGEPCPLPRYPSEDFKPNQLPELLLDTVLEPGDLLFIPRGYIHQGETIPTEQDNSIGHSLHVTLSTAQNNSMADFLELLMPQAMASLVNKSVEMRSSLPPDYLDYTGVVHSDLIDEDDEQDDQDEEEDEEGNGELSKSRKRAQFVELVKGHLFDVMQEAAELIDATADQMGKRYLSDRLPPVLSSWEEENSAEGSHEFAEEAKLKQALMYGKLANVKNGKLISSKGGVKLRMLRKGLARLCIEDGMAVVYHCIDNARWHHGAEMRPLEFPLDDAPAIDFLINAYPEPIAVRDLPHPSSTEDLETKAEIAAALFKEGFLVMVDDDEEES